uniref:RBPJ-interacting and tubulin-associated protein 1 n=1 Tax=Ciona intestinalis TaxID=7719 RepID=F6R4Q7_CIOIN|nr:uncharacterized protein LOC100179159 [Ciona intestinalis]|eukprot:XP_002128957.1 uncharacterized protein LOC100179159 [Ciona intestinalis]
MDSTNSPFTLLGKQMITPSPKTNKQRNSYRTKSSMSEADETLFGVPTRYAQQVETKRPSSGKQWDPPWVTSPTKKGAPLLWTPFDYKGFDDSLSPEGNENTRSNTKPRTPRSARTPNKYRLKKHTPTYVDETLFGSRLKDPSFQVPWSGSNNSNNNESKDISWSPDMKNLTPRPGEIIRPVCPLSVYDDPYIPPTPRDAPRSAPVIRARPGSLIKTPQKKSSKYGGVKQKLDFSDPDEKQKEELIQRALRLAQVSREAAEQNEMRLNLENARNDFTWKRPSSASTVHSQRNRPRSARMSDFQENENFLSATGVRVPLSARSDSGSRPNSARSRPSSARRSNMGGSSTDRPSWRP